MTDNKVYDKLMNFALSEISFNTFELMLKESTQSNPIRIGWKTEEGKNRYYFAYWDSAAYVGGNAGGSATKEAEGMVNLQVMDIQGDWRTIDYNTVTKCRFNGQTFKVI
jgi:hypothetical protein